MELGPKLSWEFCSMITTPCPLSRNSGRICPHFPISGPAPEHLRALGCVSPNPKSHLLQFAGLLLGCIAGPFSSCCQKICEDERLWSGAALSMAGRGGGAFCHACGDGCVCVCVCVCVSPAQISLLLPALFLVYRLFLLTTVWFCLTSLFA
jgi:hypothetical protein